MKTCDKCKKWSEYRIQNLHLNEDEVFEKFVMDVCSVCSDDDALYMKVTKDEFQLPMAVAGSTRELAEMLGVQRHSINNYLKRPNSGFLKVDVGDSNE